MTTWNQSWRIRDPKSRPLRWGVDGGCGHDKYSSGAVCGGEVPADEERGWAAAGGRAAVDVRAARSQQRGHQTAVDLAVQFAQHLVEGGLRLEADAGRLGQSDAAVEDHRVVGEATGGLELAGVGLVAAELEGCRDVQRELVSAMRNAAA